MTPKTLMTTSAAGFAALGAITLFFPEELAAAAGLHITAAFPVQLLSGGFFAIANLNWTGRGAIYGGIYGRPIVMANLMLGLITTINLVTAQLGGVLPPWGWVIAGIFGTYTFGFWKLMSSPPWPRKSAGESDQVVVDSV